VETRENASAAGGKFPKNPNRATRNDAFRAAWSRVRHSNQIRPENRK
jgi:hypothetical protein